MAARVSVDILDFIEIVDIIDIVDIASTEPPDFLEAAAWPMHGRCAAV